MQAKFNMQLLRYNLKGANFKQIGIQYGNFTICLGDKEDLRGSRPYIDNTKDGKVFGDDYEDLEDPFMYEDQQIVIARMSKSRELIII